VLAVPLVKLRTHPRIQLMTLHEPGIRGQELEPGHSNPPSAAARKCKESRRGEQEETCFRRRAVGENSGSKQDSNRSLPESSGTTEGGESLRMPEHGYRRVVQPEHPV
jgi:hypothetical protein